MTRLVADYAGITKLVRPTQIPRVIERDPDDDHIIACALAAKAGLIVSGDKHLLDLGSYSGINGINIVNAAQAIARIEATTM